ncbi:SDR family NAD(P)-dependent oxidoreductase [Pseudomonas parakoreensis]
MQQVQQHFHGLDALINVAGGFRWETIEGRRSCDLGFDVSNERAHCRNGCRMAALTHLKKAEAGRIINIAAGAASKASLGMGAYAAAKSGVMRLTEALAEELKDQRITVNAIMPSIIDPREPPRYA